ncbi:Uncharacterized protein FKW44_013881, partial [Caligus rogercresseyi]
MSSEQDRRAAILVTLRAGRASKQIIEFPKPLSIELKTGPEAKRGPQSFSTSSRRGSKQSRHLYEGLAAKTNVDEKTIKNAVHEDLRSKSYVLKVIQMLFEASKAKIGSRTISPCLVEGDVAPCSPDCNP